MCASLTITITSSKLVFSYAIRTDLVVSLLFMDSYYYRMDCTKKTGDLIRVLGSRVVRMMEACRALFFFFMLVYFLAMATITKPVANFLLIIQLDEKQNHFSGSGPRWFRVTSASLQMVSLKILRRKSSTIPTCVCDYFLSITACVQQRISKFRTK